MTETAPTFDTLSLEARRDLPPQVEAAVQEAGRCVVVSASSAERIMAYLVAAPEHRWVEVFELGDPSTGWDGPTVALARRYRFLADRVFHDRTSYFSEDEDDPGVITDSIIYSEPHRGTRRIATTARGVVMEHVSENSDTSQQYAPKPGAGDWAFFLTFGRD